MHRTLMEGALAQIGILAAGIVAANVILRVGSSAARRMRSALHRPAVSEKYYPQIYYQTMETPSYPYYQSSGYYYRG
jgi:hypothetical protein